MNRLRHWLMGRYGYDELGAALLIFAVLMMFVASLTEIVFFMSLGFALFFFAAFRFFSRDMYRRKLENDRFLRRWLPARAFCVKKIGSIKKRIQYKYFKCPFCGLDLRAPRKKGKITVTCNRCKSKFGQKT
ncbi:MAG: hypothetical protein PHF89_00280 [Eubacteriales bacterium]|jgi:hypothetical protein|nr:hypothetical protein [Eubacteriales bacterium]